MSYKTIFKILILLVLALVLFGCITNTPVCGDGVCSVGEENTCANDCGVLEYGTLQVKIIPGSGVVFEDLNILNGITVSVCGGENGGCKKEIIHDDLTILLESYPIGFYTLKGSANLDSGVPISIDSSKVVYVSSDGNYDEIEAILGVSYSLSVVEDSTIISPDKINVLSYCEYSELNEDSCNDSEGVTWEDIFENNSFSDKIELVQSDFFYVLPTVYGLKLEYNGVVKDFNYKLDQGLNDIIFKFDGPVPPVWYTDILPDANSWDDAMYRCTNEIGGRVPGVIELCNKMKSDPSLFPLSKKYWTNYSTPDGFYSDTLYLDSSLGCFNFPKVKTTPGISIVCIK